MLDFGQGFTFYILTFLNIFHAFFLTPKHSNSPTLKLVSLNNIPYFCTYGLP